VKDEQVLGAAASLSMLSPVMGDVGIVAKGLTRLSATGSSNEGWYTLCELTWPIAGKSRALLK
jgi:hypothetical protein